MRGLCVSKPQNTLCINIWCVQGCVAVEHAWCPWWPTHCLVCSNGDVSIKILPRSSGSNSLIGWITFSFTSPEWSGVRRCLCVSRLHWGKTACRQRWRRALSIVHPCGFYLNSYSCTLLSSMLVHAGSIKNNFDPASTNSPDINRASVRSVGQTSLINRVVYLVGQKSMLGCLKTEWWPLRHLQWS